MNQSSLRARMLEAFRVRMYIFLGIVVISFLILFVQLINLQLVQGNEYSERSRLNMENNIPITAPRGEIYDRNFAAGERSFTIASNRPSFNVTTIPSKFNSRKQFRHIVRNLSILTGVEEKEILKQAEGHNNWERIVLVEDVDFSTIVKIASHNELFPNIDWEDAPVRVYNSGNSFAHVAGYTGNISRSEYRRLKMQGYRHYQKIGKTGIEKQYDSELRGSDGFIRRIVDVRNRTEGEEIGARPLSGNNLVLTIDAGVQKAASDAMKDMRGAAVAIKPSTGEVIALVSKPDFDTNLLNTKNNSALIAEISTNKEKPFLNRVIQSMYPPASTFKLVTAVAALETEKGHPSLTYTCYGKYTLKGYVDRDFYCYEVHGTLDLPRAIAKSCSVYFYQLGYKTGPTSILQYADYFGLNQKSEIDLPGETAGFIPSKKWKLKTFNQPWFDGDTINLSIGQGFLSVTPMAMAQFTSAIVNGGMVYIPHIMKEIRSPDNSKIIKKNEIKRLREIPLSPVTLNTVKQGMRLSVTGGTSAGLSYLKVPAAGKTGTAQTRSSRHDDASQHGWFTGFAPFGAEPEKAVVVTVMIEQGVAGAATAVPVAARIFSRLEELGYFK